MNSRRNAIKKLGAIFAINSFSFNNALACGVTQPIKITLYTAKNYLKNFYKGEFKDFLNKQYHNKWVLSEGVEFKQEEYEIAENPNVVAISVSANFRYNKNELYCSGIDLIYKDNSFENGNVQYTIASINIAKEALPYFSTRFRMSSNKAQVYAAITLKYINSNQVKEVRVSTNPVHFLAHSCDILTYEYINA
jgi:hypothetical protein